MTDHINFNLGMFPSNLLNAPLYLYALKEVLGVVVVMGGYVGPLVSLALRFGDLKFVSRVIKP